MENSWLELRQNSNQLAKVVDTNKKTEQFGLVLSEEDALLILNERQRALRTHKRVEFGEGVISKIIYEFCDSEYITQDNYVSSMIRLQEIFYMYKNEMMDEITDDELLHLMREQFDKLCFGDLDYLESTCLAEFSDAIKAGYRDYTKTGVDGAYCKFNEKATWNYQLFEMALQEVFGR